MAKGQIIEEFNRLRSVKSKEFYRARVSYSKPVSKISDHLQFRVKYSNIGIEAYGPDNPGGIGVQVIEFNNYIL